jgi:hypothetical protein
VTAQHRPEGTWRALLASPRRSDALIVQRLADGFRTVERDRSDLGVLAGPRRRDEPGYRWFPYKEAFSPGLVRAVLDHWSGVGGLFLDNFAGSSTSLLVAAERGLDAVGVELLPYAQWAADAVVRAHAADAAIFRTAVDVATEAARSGAGSGPPGLLVPAASWALSDEVSSTLLALREALPTRGSGVEADLAHLALVSVVESVSVAVKDGTSLRHRERERKGRSTRPGRKGQQFTVAEVVDAFVVAANVIVEDLAKMPGGTEARVLLGDARGLPLGDATAGSAVFSPPYPNRYDYSAIYQLELAAGGFVRVPADLRRIRKSLLRSHLEAPPPDSLLLDDPAVLAVLRAVAAAAAGGPGERGRTLRMLVGYFDDMCRVFAELVRVLRPGAPAACVVATQTFFGYPVPTDVMLASIARRAGLVVEELWVLRHKRVAVQQRARGGVTSTGGRESVLLMRRP